MCNLVIGEILGRLPVLYIIHHTYYIVYEENVLVLTIGFWGYISLRFCHLPSVINTTRQRVSYIACEFDKW